MELSRTGDGVILRGREGASTPCDLADKVCQELPSLERQWFFGTWATGKCAGDMPLDKRWRL